MTAHDLMNELKARGVTLRLEHDRLKFRPVDKVTDLLEVMRQHKAIIRSTLTLERLVYEFDWVRVEYQPPGEFIGPYPLEVSELVDHVSLPRVAKALADMSWWIAYHKRGVVYRYPERVLN